MIGYQSSSQEVGEQSHKLTRSTHVRKAKTIPLILQVEDDPFTKPLIREVVRSTSKWMGLKLLE